MRKSTKILKRLIALIFVVLMSIESMAVAVSDNDGAAFITKAEFDSLRSEFQKELNARNEDIDNKISNIINLYLNGITTKTEKNLESMLNKLSQARRTFVNNISNPSTSKQENIYISTNGFWTSNWSKSNEVRASGDSTPDPERYENKRWFGWFFAGLNNYDLEPGQGTHHIRGPWEKNNKDHGDGKGTGKYVFIDNIVTGNDTGYYITDSYLKDLKFKIWSLGADELYPLNFDVDNTSPRHLDTASISWPNVHYNWTGTNVRKVGTYKPYGSSNTVEVSVQAAETIYLDIANDSLIPWVDNTASGAVYTASTGCLDTDDQYNWTYYKTDFSLGIQGNQVYGAAYYITTEPVYTRKPSTYINDYSYTNRTKLNFYMPKISEISGNKLGGKDVYNVTGVISYYHSGLPLARVDKPGNLKIKLNVTRKSNNKSVIVAIKKKMFNNQAISAETGSDLLFRRTYSSSDLSKGYVDIDISEAQMNGIFDTILWIKAYESSDTNGYVILDTESIKITQSS